MTQIIFIRLLDGQLGFDICQLGQVGIGIPLICSSKAETEKRRSAVYGRWYCFVRLFSLCCLFLVCLVLCLFCGLLRSSSLLPLPFLIVFNVAGSTHVVYLFVFSSTLFIVSVVWGRLVDACLVFLGALAAHQGALGPLLEPLGTIWGLSWALLGRLLGLEAAPR